MKSCAHLRRRLGILLLARFLPLLLMQLFRRFCQVFPDYLVPGRFGQGLAKLLNRCAPLVSFPKGKSGVVSGMGLAKNSLALGLARGRLLGGLLGRDLLGRGPGINWSALLNGTRRPQYHIALPTSLCRNAAD